PMSYRLWYFPLRGRAEQIRLMLHEIDAPFDDRRVLGRDEFMQLKQQGPSMLTFGSLPMLEDGDLRLCQGPVILSYLARKHGVAPAELQAAARADAIAWGAEDLRVKYFGLFGENKEAKQAEFVGGDLATRWLPNFDGLLALNGDTGFFVGASLTHADIAVWDILIAFLS